MRTQHLLLILPLIAMSSCGVRTTWDSAPDRRKHAYNADKASVARSDASAPASQSSGILRETVPTGPIQGAERYYTVADGERLYQVAEHHGVSMYWLIKRNDLSALPYTGKRLIVPGATH